MNWPTAAVIIVAIIVGGLCVIAALYADKTPTDKK